MARAATTGLMQRLNRSAILSLIRSEGPIARTAIAQRLGMSLPTVMRAVDKLVDKDLAHFTGSAPSGGRRSPLLSFNGAAHAVASVDLGGTKMHGMVMDFMGNLQHERSVAVRREGKPELALASLYQLIEELLNAPRPRGQRIRGIAVGAPGITLNESGTIVWAPSLGWRDFPLRDLLAERFAYPVFVENDVNLATLGEHGFGLAAGSANLVTIAIGTGIGAGIMLDGKLYRGHNQAAGEVGYFLPGLEYLGQRYDKFGAIEDIASGRGIARRARLALSGDGARRSSDTDVTTEKVFAEARSGVAWAQKIVAETVDYLTLIIAGIAALLNPEVIILSGGVSRSEDLLIEPIRQRIDGLIPYVPRIVASNLGSHAVGLGAILIALDATTGHVIIDQRT